MREELEKIRTWADEKLASGKEPSWAWYQYMKLRETCDAILAGMATTAPVGSLLSEAPQGTHLRLVGAECQQDNAQPHPDTVRVVLPM